MGKSVGGQSGRVLVLGEASACIWHTWELRITLDEGTGMSEYRAVIFDLWGTLVDEVSHPEEKRLTYRQKTYEMADLLGADRERFAKAWSNGAIARIAGAFSSTEEALLHICKELGVDAGDDQVTAAVGVRYEFIRAALSPRPGTVETLATLRKLGYQVGLVSNCGDEVSHLWDSTPLAQLFDAVVLSFEVRLTKPNIRIYETAAKRLGVSAGQCLYVGDGSDGELSGASEAGMTAMLMRAPYDLADRGREDWDGDSISAIHDVLDLL